MENEKLILEMLKKMDERMIKMDEQLINMDARMKEGFTKVDARFDAIDERFDKIESRLEKVHNRLLIMAMPEVEPTEEELEAIRIGKEQIENGEFTRYTTFEELKRDIMKD